MSGAASDGSLERVRRFVSRAELRKALGKALAVLESEGRVRPHVGRGAFAGARPLREFASRST